MAKGKEKIVHLTAGRLTFKSNRGQPKTEHGDTVISPTGEGCVSSGFHAWGTFDPGTNHAECTLVLKSDPSITYPGTPVDPPIQPGADWEFEFDNIPPATYKLIDKETSVVVTPEGRGINPLDAKYIIDPLCVSQ